MDHFHKVVKDNHYPSQVFQQAKTQCNPTESQTHPQENS